LGTGGNGVGGSGALGSAGAAAEAGDAGGSVSDAGAENDAAAGDGGDGEADVPFDAVDCPAQGGICVLAGECNSLGGTVPEGASGGCHFDDGDAECCIPPEPQPSGTSCTEVGGVCTSIGGCLQSGGYSTPPEISCEGGVGITCCVAGDRCGEVDIECCADGTTFRPACDAGEFVCVAGEPHPLGSCP
jgi:hypothetical protein